MSSDKIREENPTPIEQLKRKFMEAIFEQQLALIEAFLGEFCEVNGIEETELSEHFQLMTQPGDYSVVVADATDARDIKFGVKALIRNESTTFVVNFHVFGEHATNVDLYPKTFALLDDIENGRNTRDTSVTSREQRAS